MQQRESAEINRLHQVVDLITADTCQTTILAKHFEENLEQACGHCSWCLQGSLQLPERELHGISSHYQSAVSEWLTDNPTTRSQLHSPRALARFLCGITSPALSRGKLSKLAMFGRLGETPFKEVLTWTEQFFTE